MTTTPHGVPCMASHCACCQSRMLKSAHKHASEWTSTPVGNHPGQLGCGRAFVVTPWCWRGQDIMCSATASACATKQLRPGYRRAREARPLTPEEALWRGIQVSSPPLPLRCLPARRTGAVRAFAQRDGTSRRRQATCKYAYGCRPKANPLQRLGALRASPPPSRRTVLLHFVGASRFEPTILGGSAPYGDTICNAEPVKAARSRGAGKRVKVTRLRKRRPRARSTTPAFGGTRPEESSRRPRTGN